MATNSVVDFCAAQGVQVQLECGVKDGQAINRNCSLQSGCYRYLKPAQLVFF